MQLIHHIALFALLLAAGSVSAQLPSRAGTTAVFGVFDGNTADSPGEASFTLGNVVSGMPADSLQVTDTVVVDTVYAMSSLESLAVQDSAHVKLQDTVDFRYVIQHQGNLAADSFYVLVNVPDTLSVNRFAPSYLRILDKATTEQGGALSADSAWYGVLLAEGAIDTFYVRAVIPGGTGAADGDSAVLAVTVRDRGGLGTYDGWPAGRVFIDTSGQLLHLQGDTLRDYGDTQTDSVVIGINSYTMRIWSRVNKTTAPPGDTLTYSIVYDNDGSGATMDSVRIQQMLPVYVDYDAGSAGGAYHSGESGTVIRFSAHAGVTIFDKNAAWADAVPESVAGIRWTFATPIGAQTGGDNPGLADDTTGEADGGYVQFKVIVK